MGKEEIDKSNIAASPPPGGDGDDLGDDLERDDERTPRRLIPVGATIATQAGAYCRTGFLESLRALLSLVRRIRFHKRKYAWIHISSVRS